MTDRPQIDDESATPPQGDELLRRRAAPGGQRPRRRRCACRRRGWHASPRRRAARGRAARVDRGGATQYGRRHGQGQAAPLLVHVPAHEPGLVLEGAEGARRAGHRLRDRQARLPARRKAGHRRDDGQKCCRCSSSRTAPPTRGVVGDGGARARRGPARPVVATGRGLESPGPTRGDGYAAGPMSDAPRISAHTIPAPRPASACAPRPPRPTRHAPTRSTACSCSTRAASTRASCSSGSRTSTRPRSSPSP